MREIEVKARLRDKQAFLNVAKTLGIVFGPEIHQHDTTYTNKQIENHAADWNIFRIREQDGKNILTMKFDASDRPRDNHEFETTIGSKAEIESMLNRLQYTFDVHVDKRRRKARFEDLEICLDEVEQLGTFVEVEALTADTADVDAVQARLWSLLRRLGTDEEDRVYEGYPSLMRDHASSKIA